MRARTWALTGASFGLIAAAWACARPAETAITPSNAPVLTVPPTAAELRRDLMVFASDTFRGRETGTPDERRAAAFLIARASHIGLDPAGDSGYVQRVPLTRIRLGAGTHFTVQRSGSASPAREVAGLVPLISPNSIGTSAKLHAEGDLVFAGYGVARPGGGDDLAKLPIEGRVVVVINGAPPGADAAWRSELESPNAIGARLGRILARRPAAVIILVMGASADLYEPMRRAVDHGFLQLASTAPSDTGARAGGTSAAPMLMLGEPAPESPLLPRRWPRDDRAQVLTGMRFTAVTDIQRTPVESFNVVAALPGSDPALQHNWVAYSAHYDHLGIVPAAAGDSVAHGADDDGSGSVALLAIARAMRQAPRPRRSVLFVWHTGEEEGLLGSAYFASHPLVPLDSIVALINADMIGRNAPESLYVVGPRVAPHGISRPLGKIVDSVNASLPLPFRFGRMWDSPTNPQRVYYRGDAYPYGERGVPVAFFTTGLHPDYQQVSDEPSRIDYTKLAHVSQLLFEVGETLANRDARPQ
jgi:Peptidase family M28